MDLTTGKERIALSVTRISLSSPEDNRIETMAAMEHVGSVKEERRVKEPDQHPKPKVITLMGGS